MYSNYNITYVRNVRRKPTLQIQELHVVYSHTSRVLCQGSWNCALTHLFPGNLPSFPTHTQTEGLQWKSSCERHKIHQRSVTEVHCASCRNVAHPRMFLCSSWGTAENTCLVLGEKSFSLFFFFPNIALFWVMIYMKELQYIWLEIIDKVSLCRSASRDWNWAKFSQYLSYSLSDFRRLSLACIKPEVLCMLSLLYFLLHPPLRVSRAVGEQAKFSSVSWVHTGTVHLWEVYLEAPTDNIQLQLPCS